MTVTITTIDEAPALAVVGEAMRPLVTASGGARLEVFETSGPADVGPPPHRHDWDEVYVVLEGALEVFDGATWERVGPGQVVHISAGDVHGYRNAVDGTRFLTITGAGPSPGGASAFFTAVDDEIKQFPPDLEQLAPLAMRHGVEPVLP